MSAKKPFLRVTEVWTPSDDGKELVLARGDYGSLSEFEDTSENTKFALGEGLPGLAWQEGRPVVMHELKKPMFVREDVAARVGLTCGVAIPIVRGTETLAVLALFCGDDEEHIGAIEVWNAASDSNELSLHDGYFGTATKFEFQAKHMNFRKGIGLPGITWEIEAPVIMDDLGRTKRFVRRDSADLSGITRGVGIPLNTTADGSWILAILSAMNTPIARRFEIWHTNETEDALTFASGVCESGVDLSNAYMQVQIPKGSSTLGRVLNDGRPWLSSMMNGEDPVIAASCNDVQLTKIFAMPVFANERMTSVIAWYS